MILPNLYRCFSRQGPTFQGRVFNVTFNSGTVGPIDALTAHRLSQLGDFVVLPWDDAVAPGEWVLVSTSPLNWNLNFVPLGNTPGAAGGSLGAPGVLPSLADVDWDHLPVECPEQYRRLFRHYSKNQNGSKR
jgi:hypothetical protein